MTLTPKEYEEYPPIQDATDNTVQKTVDQLQSALKQTSRYSKQL